ncbi:MAG: hypothetical protein VW912_05175 [Flavobacteriaceae bacterium]
MKNLWLISATHKHPALVEASFAYDNELIVLKKTQVTPDLGEHILKVTPYKNGKRGIPLSIDFTLIDEDILHTDEK